jgi:hypothetical protein
MAKEFDTSETNRKLKNLKVGGKTSYTEVVMTLDTNVYATGEVLAATQVVPNVLNENLGTGIIHSVILLDKDDQAGALDIVFLRTDVSIGTENGALNPTDAVADEIIGVIEVSSTDYIDLINSQIVCKTNLGYGFQGDSGQHIYVALISRDSKTYTANGITLKIVVLQD